PDNPPERVIVVTGRITVDAVRRALPGVPAGNILAEPVGRNTAPCIGWAALHVRRRDPAGLLAVLPADHVVDEPEGFRRAVRIAVAAAREGGMVTFGITPDRPETGFGYIELGEEISPGVRAVARFVEKPDLPTARACLESGRHVWNSGMFFFTAERILGEIGRQLPELARGLAAIDAAADREGEVERIFAALPSISVDYGVMEGAADLACVPAAFGWSDLGSWAAAHEHARRDPDGNALPADAVAIDARGCLARVPMGKLVALVGVTDLMVVDTGDALLICPRERAQDVKQVVETLERRGRRELL
ncbi:MAG TPA: sugar phosphate nucleotidyltransferase, partial [Phycisphaerae bacterium]|nr:sugar phosphate nucleotidyltransferase [Phycisphaerae bacterium]